MNYDRRHLSTEVINRLGLKHSSTLHESVKDVMVQCPFHKDMNPSMGINIEKGIFNCFSCGKSGSIESLFKELTGTSIYKILNIKSDSFNMFAYKPHVFEEEDFGKSLDNIFINVKGTLLPYTAATTAVQYLRKRAIPFQVASNMKMNHVA